MPFPHLLNTFSAHMAIYIDHAQRRRRRRRPPDAHSRLPPRRRFVVARRLVMYLNTHLYGFVWFAGVKIPLHFANLSSSPFSNAIFPITLMRHTRALRWITAPTTCSRAPPCVTSGLRIMCVRVRLGLVWQMKGGSLAHCCSPCFASITEPILCTSPAHSLSVCVCTMDLSYHCARCELRVSRAVAAGSLHFTVRCAIPRR